MLQIVIIFATTGDLDNICSGIEDIRHIQNHSIIYTLWINDKNKLYFVNNSFYNLP